MLIGPLSPVYLPDHLFWQHPKYTYVSQRLDSFTFGAQYNTLQYESTLFEKKKKKEKEITSLYMLLFELI